MCYIYIYIYIYICIIGAQLGGSGGRSPLPCFKNQKKCPDFGKKTLILSLFGLHLPYVYTRACFKKIQKCVKKLSKFIGIFQNTC